MQEKNLIKERRMKNCKATVGDKKNNNQKNQIELLAKIYKK